MDCCEFCLKLPNQKVSLRIQYCFWGIACICKPNYYMCTYEQIVFSRTGIGYGGLVNLINV